MRREMTARRGLCRGQDVAQRAFFQHRSRGVAGLAHDVAQAAGVDVGAIVAGAECGFAGARGHGERSVDAADHVGDADRGRGGCQPVSAGGAAAAFDQALVAELGENGLEEFLRDGGRLGKVAGAGPGAGAELLGQGDAGTKRIFGAACEHESCVSFQSNAGDDRALMTENGEPRQAPSPFR